MASEPHDGRTLLTRVEALHRREVRQAWLMLALGVVIPIVALWAAVRGVEVRRRAPGHGNVLIVAGTTVFVLRLALFVLR